MNNFEAIKEMNLEQMTEVLHHMNLCDKYCGCTGPLCTGEDCKDAARKFLTQEIPEPDKPMTINEYQKLAMRTDNKEMPWRDSLLDGVLGLNGEAGECADIVKKYAFQKHDLNLEHLIEELGDVAWYLAKCAHVLELDLEYIFKRNIEKLEQRYPEGFDVERSVNRVE